MLKGVVKFFNNDKGFGFITSDNKDYFVHFRSIKGDGYKSLSEGQSVEFLPKKGDKGWQADEVSVV